MAADADKLVRSESLKTVELALNALSVQIPKFRMIVFYAARGCGKTFLIKEVSGRYVDCEDPTNWRQFRDPVQFVSEAKQQSHRVILDEVGALPNRMEVLQELLAKGMPTLLLSSCRVPLCDFPDSIRSQIVSFELPPPLWSECAKSNAIKAKALLTVGSFPAVLAGNAAQKEHYLRWSDTCFARDLQQKADWQGVGDFLRFFDAILQRSGGLLPTPSKEGSASIELSRYGPLKIEELAHATGLTRGAVERRVEGLEKACLLVRVPALRSGSSADLCSGCKAYVFNPGLVSLAHDWSEPTAEACELLWRHVVLSHLRWFLPNKPISYWERKDRRHRIDFVVQMSELEWHAFRCCSGSEDASGDFEAFQGRFPRRKGRNFVVTNSASNRTRTQLIDGASVMVRDLTQLEAIFALFPGNAKNVLAPPEPHHMLRGRSR